MTLNQFYQPTQIEYTVCGTLQQQSKDHKKHYDPNFGGGSSVSAEGNVGNSFTAGTTHMDIDAPVPVGRKQEHAADILSDGHITNAEQTNLHPTDLLEPKMTIEEAPLQSEQLFTKNQEMTSFLQLPSFSQDSSSNTVNPTLTEKYSAETFGNSDMQREQNHLQPRIKQPGNNSVNVFPSIPSSSSDASHRKETKVLEYNTVRTDSNIDQPSDDTNEKQPSQNNEFNFWGSGINSNFEVQPMRKIPTTVNISVSSVNEQQKKRARSLNESIYDAIICVRKKREHQSSHANENAALGEGTGSGSTTAQDEGIHDGNTNKTTLL